MGLVRPCVLPMGLLETGCALPASGCKVPASPFQRGGKKAKDQERVKADWGGRGTPWGKGGWSLTAASGALSDGPFEVWMLVVGICLHGEQRLKPF